jgi:MerR family redox-sensitive transcriptional activator SoxR
MIRIGELSRQTGLAASALRYYEELGLLVAPGRSGGKRVYGEQALDRIAFIQFARACGFRLEEIAVLLEGEDETGSISSRWRQLATDKLQEMDEIIARAEGMKRYLSAALTCECAGADMCGRIIRENQA